MLNFMKKMQRFDLEKVLPDGYAAMLRFSHAVKPVSITPLQAELIKIRASQINGCAFCLQMHVEKALTLGETIPRLSLVAAWRDTSLFTKEEKAILALTEEITDIRHQVSDATYEKANAVLGEEAIAEVTLINAVINAWNRLMITSGKQAV